MNKTEFTAELDLLVASYPNAFPTGTKERVAIAAIWYDHFQHIPKELFAKASKYCRGHERFLSIASLSESIVQVADVPSEYEIRKLVELKIEDAPYNFPNPRTPLHPIAERIYEALGLNYVGSEMTDFAFEREYKRAREWWVEKIMQPENVALLIGQRLLEGEHGT